MISRTSPHQGVVASISNRIFAASHLKTFITVFIFFYSSCGYSQVLINEVVTDPQVDWSTNSFDGSDGLGTIDTNDEWIELYVVANGVDLTGWTIELNDGTDESGILSSGGAFTISNYISGTGGLFTDTDAGDYIVIGQPTSGSMDATITVILRDNTMAIIDQVVISGGSGTFFTGASTGITDESVCRIPNGTDTNIDAADFVLTQATLGADNSPLGTVLINEVVTDPQQDWSTNGFDGTDGGGTINSDDDWVELFIGSTGLNLTKWTIELNDGTDVSGTLAAGGAFQVIDYISQTGGSFTDTDAGDYLVLGTMTTGAINQSVTVVLRDAYSNIVDQLEIASGSGTMFTGNANDVDDESVCRIPNGQDTDVEVNDFVKTRATLGTNNSPQGTVLINEVVTDPVQDWSSGGFIVSEPGGTSGSDDEWIELYIGSSGLNLTKWIISVEDGTDFSGDLTSSGAFAVSAYIGSGSFNNTVAGDYLILGNPVSTNAINNSVYITLTDPYGTMVDDVEIGDDQEGDGADGAPSGASSSISDETVFRVPLGADTDVDAQDFQKGLPSLGMENGVVYVDASAPDDTGLGTQANPKQLIQSGIDIAPLRGSVNVAAGTYAENLTISQSVQLRGANEGIAGNGTRVAETIIEPLTQSNAIDIDADSVVVDGFQIGISNVDAGIFAIDNSNLFIQNNVINADSLGISFVTATDKSIQVSNNLITMTDFTTLNTSTITSGIYLASLGTDVDVDLINNDYSGGANGILVFDCLSSNVLTISNDTISNATRGLSVFSTNGVTRGSSTLNVTGMSVSNMDEVPGGILNYPEAGIYFFSDGASTNSHLITASISNSSFSDVANTTSDYSGIICGDFSSANFAEYLQDITITNCQFSDNENRGIYARGQNTRVAIAQSTFSNNGHDPFGAGGNWGFNLVVRNNAEMTVVNSFLNSPASQTTPGVDFEFRGMSLQVGSSLSISNSHFDNNGNVRGLLAATTGIDLSGNYFGTTVEADLDTLVNSNDFTPWLTSGSDTDGLTSGFQGDFSDLMVGVSGAQTGSSGRIEEGISLVDVSGTVTVNAGTYPENLAISKSLFLNGANQGIAGSGTRGAESIIEPLTANIGIDIGAADITVDGFQFGTNNTTSNNSIAISNTGFTGLTVSNNVIFANTSGIAINGLSSGTAIVSANAIEMLNLEDPLNSNSPSFGINAQSISGTADVDFIDNDIQTASYGFFGFALTASPVVTIDGGNYSGCTKGIEINNTDGLGAFSPSNATVTNVTMSGFVDPGAGLAQPDTQAGIYVFTTGAATSVDDIAITIENVDISGIGNSGTDYAAIYIADFQATGPFLGTDDDDIGITANITNSNIHDNLNRGIHTRGRNAISNISACIISGNGSNPNPGAGAGVNVYAQGTANVQNSTLTNPASGAATLLVSQQQGTITAFDNSLDNNGNAAGLLADIQSGTTGTINMSGNWLGTTSEASILSIIDFTPSDIDFTPYLESGADSDAGTLGFQGSFDALTVTPSGDQTLGDRVQEGHDLVNTDGTVTVLQSDYAESLTVSKDIVLDPELNTTIDDVTLDGGRLNVLVDLEINNTLTLTNGILDIDLDDGDKSDDPVLILNSAVAGSFDDANHVEGKISKDIVALGSFFFPVGDADTYRPVTLEPLNSVTFAVSHIEEPTPTGAGIFGTIEALVGTASSVFNPLNIESVMNFRYWTIDVLSGVPGLTTITLQATGADEITDPSSLGILRFDGVDWLELTLLGGSGTNPYTVSATTVSFSDFTLYSSDVDANPLPVDLVDFTGKFEKNDVRLSWSTLTEVNSDYFQIERSEDGKTFKAIGSVSSHGNTNLRHDYSYLDMNAGEQVFYYRLKMVDFDGYFEYSPTIQVSPDLSNLRVLVYPNPTSGSIKIHDISPSLILGVDFFDLNGKLHKHLDSINDSIINLNDLQNGHYLLRLQMIDGSVFEGEVIKK